MADSKRKEVFDFIKQYISAHGYGPCPAARRPSRRRPQASP